MNNVLQFLNGVKREFSKVTWPKKNELFDATFVVLALIFAFSCYLGLVDLLLAKAITAILSL